MEKVRFISVRRRSKFALPLLLLILTVIQIPRDQATLAAGSQSNDEAQIRQALADFVKASNSGDRKTANTIWATDLIGWYPGRPDDTYERQMQIAARQPTVKPTTTLSLTINEVIVRGDLAVVRDTWGYTRETPRPDLPDVLRGFEVWRKQADGSWKISRWISAPEPKQAK